MSVPKTKARWFRVYSADRKVRKPIGANTLEEFISEGMELITCRLYYFDNSFVIQLCSCFFAYFVVKDVLSINI